MPVADETCCLENEKAFTQFCRTVASALTLKYIRDDYNQRIKKVIKDEKIGRESERGRGQKWEGAVSLKQKHKKKKQNEKKETLKKQRAEKVTQNKQNTQ